MYIFQKMFFVYILNIFIYNINMNINIDVNIFKIILCVYLYIHNKYTQNAHIYYANRNFYFVCDKS